MKAIVEDPCRLRRIFKVLSKSHPPTLDLWLNDPRLPASCVFMLTTGLETPITMESTDSSKKRRLPQTSTGFDLSIDDFSFFKAFYGAFDASPEEIMDVFIDKREAFAQVAFQNVLHDVFGVRDHAS